MTVIPEILDDRNPAAEGLYHGDSLHSFTCKCEDCVKWNAEWAARFAKQFPPLSDKEADEQHAASEAFKAECAARVDEREWAEGMAVWTKALADAERLFLHLDDPEYPALLAAMEMEGVESSAKLAYLKAHDAAFLDGETDADADAAGRKAKDAVTAKGERATLRAMEAYSASSYMA